MGKIVVNPHRNTEEEILRELSNSGNILTHRGEILICNEPENEGIYILNSRKQLIRVGTNLATASSAVTEDDLDQLETRLNQEIGNAVNGILTNTYTKEETDNRIEELLSGYSGTTIDEEAVKQIVHEEISGITQNIETIDSRLSHVENVINGISKTTDHFVMTYDQYQELITSGSVYVEGYDIITYSDDHFYCIYEGETPQPTPTPSSGAAIMSGDTVIFDENYPYEDGEVPSLYIGEITDEGAGVISVDWFTNNGGDEEPSGDVDGDTVTINDTLYDSGEPLNIGTIEEGDEDGVVNVPWEI